jgi:hypothetical protein
MFSMRTFNPDAIKWVYTLIGSALSKFSTEADSQLLASSVYRCHCFRMATLRLERYLMAFSL